MNYTEAIKALLAGEAVEALSGKGPLRMRMHESLGPEIECSPNNWSGGVAPGLFGFRRAEKKEAGK
jgi:hypothetical protein